MRTANGIFTPYSLPGQINTEYLGLNQAGFVTGSYTIVNTQNPTEPFELMYGFIRSPNGVISSFEVPGTYTTVPVDINNLNVVVGWSGKGAFLRIPDTLAL